MKKIFKKYQINRYFQQFVQKNPNFKIFINSVKLKLNKYLFILLKNI